MSCFEYTNENRATNKQTVQTTISNNYDGITLNQKCKTVVFLGLWMVLYRQTLITILGIGC